jgi:hypothetical protein
VAEPGDQVAGSTVSRLTLTELALQLTDPLLQTRHFLVVVGLLGAEPLFEPFDDVDERRHGVFDDHGRRVDTPSVEDGRRDGGAAGCCGLHLSDRDRTGFGNATATCVRSLVGLVARCEFAKPVAVERLVADRPPPELVVTRNLRLRNGQAEQSQVVPDTPSPAAGDAHVEKDSGGVERHGASRGDALRHLGSLLQSAVCLETVLDELVEVGQRLVLGRGVWSVAPEARLVGLLQRFELLDLLCGERAHQRDVVGTRPLVVHPPGDQAHQLHLLHDRGQVGAVALGLGDADEAAQLARHLARVVHDDAVVAVQREQDEVAQGGLLGLPGDRCSGHWLLPPSVS